ncbi:MAG: hypothetical protein IPL26_01570 [Leptospiraceae bacterium]|nr:hypothetical protein [Leptospiraceae bacterium]
MKQTTIIPPKNLLRSFVQFFLLTSIIYFIGCADLPRREFPQHSFSPILNIKEFTPNKPKSLPPIVIYDPVLLKESALFRVEENSEKGIISFLNREGYTVYLLSSKTANLNFRLHAMEIDEILNQIAYKHKFRKIILAGVSLGGQTILEYMTLPTNLDNYAHPTKVFFIGTGIDYNYTNSFAKKSDKFGYEGKLVQDLCRLNQKDNFCTRYIYFNNELQDVDNSKKEKFFHRIPEIKKDYITRIHNSKLHLPYFFLYGKLDSISPEESIYPFFHKIRPASSRGDYRNSFYEAGEANGHSIDYDHGDLFLHEKADKEIYSELADWLLK